MGDVLNPQLGEPHHHAYLVDDIAATVERLAEQFGAGPFFLVEDVPLENVVSRGEPAEFAHSSAFGFGAGGPIELIQVDRVAPERVQRGFAISRPALHHIGYAMSPTEVDDLRSALDQRGLTEFLSSQLGEVQNTLHDASASLGHHIEVLVDSEELRAFFGMVTEAAQGWDGSDRLRRVES